MRYPVILENDAGAWGASVPDMPGVFATGTSRAEAVRRVREAMFAYVLELRREGRSPAAPGTADLEPLGPDESLEHIAPEDPDPISLAVDGAIRRSGLTKTEVARRMGIGLPGLSRLTDPLYHGHSADSLRKVAQALDMPLEVSFGPAAQPSRQPRGTGVEG